MGIPTRLARLTGDENLSTGILTGLEVTINGGDNTKFDIAAGTGIVMDWTVPATPVRTLVTFAGVTAESVPDITKTFTSLAIDAAGTLFKTTDTLPTNQQKKVRIDLQSVIHRDGVVIDEVAANSVPAYQKEDAILDYIKELGELSTDNDFTANGVNLQIDKSAGTTSLPFINRGNDLQDPSTVTNAAQVPVTAIERTHLDGVGGFVLIPGQTVIDSANYDDGSGVLAAVPANMWTVQRIYFVGRTDDTVIVYGQATYGTQAQAESNIILEDPTVSPVLLATATLTTALILESGATDLSDLGQAKFVDMDVDRPVGFANLDTDLGGALQLVDGGYLDEPAITVSSDGATITCSVEQEGGGDLRVLFSTGVHTWDTTPADTVTLSAGTDAVPLMNYVFFLESTLVLTANTTGFPATEHAPVATVRCQTASGVQADGPHKVQAWTDHMRNGNVGHLAHINAWIRQQSATWVSGVLLTPTITGQPTEDNIDIATTVGVIRQLHEHSFPAFDTGTGSDVFIVNKFGAAFTKIQDLQDADEDDAGTAITNNRWTSIVIWGAVNDSDSDSKLYVNFPSSFHSSANDAIADPEHFSNFTIPSEFTGVGFLIARLVLGFTNASGGTWTLGLNEDLRGTAVAGGGPAAANEFFTSLFRLLDSTDATKEIDFDATAIATATTRTISMPDADVNLGLLLPLIQHFQAIVTTPQVLTLGFVDVTGYAAPSHDVGDAWNFNATTGIMTFDEGGTYEITYHAYAETTSAGVAEVRVQLQEDVGAGFVTITSGDASALCGASATVKHGHASFSNFIRTFAATDTLKLQTLRIGVASRSRFRLTLRKVRDA